MNQSIFLIIQLIISSLILPTAFATVRVKSCFAFSDEKDQVELIDSSGCPSGSSSHFISAFSYDSSKPNQAEAVIHEMFQLSDSSKMTIQCEIVFCNDCASTSDCTQDGIKSSQTSLINLSGSTASTTIYVLEPNQAAGKFDYDLNLKSHVLIITSTIYFMSNSISE